MLFELSSQYVLVLLFATGLVAGTIDAIAGGGGLISLPVLLGVGVPPHIALGTNKLQAFFGTAVATYNYHRQGWLKPQGLFKGLFFSFAGSVSGAIVSQIVSSDLLKKIIPFVLLFILAYMVISPRLGDLEGKPKISENGFYIIIGSLIAFYDGFLGPGSGSMWVFFLMFFLGYSLLKATAYTKAYNLMTNLAALICFVIGNNVNYRIAIFMVAGQLIGGKFGSHLAIKKGIGIIRPIFIIMVLSAIVTLLYKNYTNSAIVFRFVKGMN